MVLPGYALISQGIQVHAGVWPGGTFARQEVLSRAFAMQAGAYVVMAGALIRPEDLPEDIRALTMEVSGNTRGMVMPCNGDSGIIGPDGEFLAGPLLNEEGVLTATANLGTVMFQKMIADHAGHYTRPDVFSFKVNATPKRIASIASNEPERVASLKAAIADGLASGGIKNPVELEGAVSDLLGTEGGA